MVRKIAPRDVMDTVYNHENPKKQLAKYGTNVVAAVLLSTALEKSRPAKRQYVWSLGYDRHVEEILDCVDKCVTFSTALTDQGYQWNTATASIVAPIAEA